VSFGEAWLDGVASENKPAQSDDEAPVEPTHAASRSASVFSLSGEFIPDSIEEDWPLTRFARLVTVSAAFWSPGDGPKMVAVEEMKLLIDHTEAMVVSSSMTMGDV